MSDLTPGPSRMRLTIRSTLNPMQVPVAGPFTETRQSLCQTCCPASTPLSCALHLWTAAPIFSAAMLRTLLDETPNFSVESHSRHRLCLANQCWCLADCNPGVTYTSPTLQEPIHLKKNALDSFLRLDPCTVMQQGKVILYAQYHCGPICH